MTAPSASGNSRRLSRQLLPKVVVAILLLVTFVLVLRQTIGSVFRTSLPAVALIWTPHDSAARAAVAMQMIEEPSGSIDLPRVKMLAQGAIQRDALNVAAIRVLGLINTLEKREAQSLALFNYAEHLSRRDLITHLWFIEHYSARGDVSNTLHHYDLALRTSRSSRELLFPLLLNASADPELQEPLNTLLRTKPNQWWREFAGSLIAEGRNLSGVVAVTRGLYDPKDAGDRSYIASLIHRLVEARAFDLGLLVYSEARASAGVRGPMPQIRDGDFELARDYYPPYDWELSSDPNLMASRRAKSNGAGLVLALTANEDDGGQVARQLLHLSAGRYRLRYLAGGVTDSVGATLKVLLTCVQKNGNPAPRIALATRAGGATEQSREGTFSVDSSCVWQWLSVQVGPGAAPSDDGPWIDNISITPDRPAIAAGQERR